MMPRRRETRRPCPSHAEGLDRDRRTTDGRPGERPLTAAPPTVPRVHPRLLALFGALDEAALEWAVLRGEDELDGRAGDVDLLVEPADLPELRRIAGSLGFARLPATGYGSHVFLIAYDEPTDRWLKLDVVDQLAFGPQFSLVAPRGTVEACLARRRGSGVVGLLDPADGFWALLLHVLLDRAAIAGERRARLVELAPAGREGGPLAGVVTALLPTGWSTDRLADAVERGAWDELGQVGRAIATAWRRSERVGAARRRLGGTVGRRAGRVVRLGRPRGLGVALVGSAELTGVLASALRAAPLPVRIGSPAGARGDGPFGVRRRRRLAEGLVVDRAESIEDLRFDPRPSGDRRSRWAKTLSSPAPDLVIVLDPDRGPDAGGAEEPRSPDGTSSVVRIVDASLPGERLRRAVGGLVWSRLADRWNAMDRGSTEP